MHRRTFFRRRYNRAELNKGIMVCRRCHQGIHRLYDEMTLAKHFNTLAQLQQDQALAQHFSWVARQRERV